MNGYPETTEQRRAGMAMVRATMLAAHQRQIAKGTLPEGDLAVQHKMVEVIQTAQIDKGEVFTFKIAKHPAVIVASVKDARDKWDEFVRRESEMGGGGCSEVGNGGIVRKGKKIVAKISYNGRVWDTKGNEIQP